MRTRLLAVASILALGLCAWMAYCLVVNPHDPARAVAQLDVHKDLQATLFASEPMLTNPTNIDIDARGRVWLCDVMNYRFNSGKRPEGDRILILDDTTGAGKADKVTVFYQGRDVDSAMGICVLGNKVIVSCSPNILVFTFDEATDKVLKKEVLFINTGQPQHDHSAHSFVFGPDGKLYWNFGNAGHQVCDVTGKPVVDRAGHAVVDNGAPYIGGMVFRCNLDGGDFAVLAHNFRNPYEVAIDSFGTLWQSDNDDDGKRAVRINYLMEFGNYGYRDERTGAGWKINRSNLETERPRRHWHLNDPGVVPNLLQTGAGAPAGICVYEGSLLPKAFQNQIIHCDAGPSIVRCYPLGTDGAGYKAEIIDILDGKRNQWFRPVDPCVAPDGSLFVSDWYDPGVGSHGQRDSDRGRVFRVAPPGVNYQPPKFDFTTAAGCAEALKNPCLSVRYRAWTTLHGMQSKAEPALLKLWHDENPRFRARALWLLGKIDGKGPHYVDLGLHDSNADLRITALRLARQIAGVDIIRAVAKIVRDPSPQVRRECAIALRHQTSPRAAELWAELALQHDGNNRWYLEALGIGADRHWDACFDAWLKKAGAHWNSPPGRDIVWRSRAAKSPEYLGMIIADTTDIAQLPRYFRAFDFQDSPTKHEILARLASISDGDEARQSLIVAEALSRLENVDLHYNTQALARLLDRRRGTPLFVELVDKFAVAGRYPELLSIAQHDPENQLGLDAIRILLSKNQRPLLEQGLRNQDTALAVATAKALGLAEDARAIDLLLAVVTDETANLDWRREAVRALAKSRNGSQPLLKLLQSKQLSEALQSAARVALSPPLAAEDHSDLPPIRELVKRQGDAVRGAGIFANIGTCANCHIVHGAGKDVGPDLSEIGAKLSREALYEAILFPSASVNLGYESYLVETKTGITVTGLMVSQTAEGIAIKGADGLVRSFKKRDVESLHKSPNSLMPADLHKLLTPQDLADLVEHLASLKETRGDRFRR